jgi:hypothetical protein
MAGHESLAPPSSTTAPATRSPLARSSGSDCNGLYRICLCTEAVGKKTTPMASLITQRGFRAVQNLPFCHLCGQSFSPNDRINRDQVPPECIFARPDRSPLLLATHQGCNSAQKLTAEKIEQPIALKWGYMPSFPENRRLKFGRSMLVGPQRSRTWTLMKRYGDGSVAFMRLCIENLFRRAE